MPTILLNGEPADIDAATTIAALLQAWQPDGRVAVEVNGQVIPRSQHAACRLQNGDRVEVVRALGGG